MAYAATGTGGWAPTSLDRPPVGVRVPGPHREGAFPMYPGSSFDPLAMLGCDAHQAQALLRGKPVTPGEVEAVALRSYRWRGHLHDPDSYWITVSQAARILHLSPGRVKQLLDQGRLPHATHRSGVRLMRRAQIEAIAQAQASGLLPS